MKKNLLLIAALLFMAAGAMAQDVYLGVSNTNSNDEKYFTVTKNGTTLATEQYSGSNYEMMDLIVDDNENVYYLKHRIISDNTLNWTDVYKISADGNRSQIYNCASNRGIILNSLACDKSNGDVYACGSYYASDYRDYPIITKNGADFYVGEESGYDGKMMGIAVVNGDVFTCGGEAANEGSSGEDYSYATIWKNGEIIGDAYDYGKYSYAYGIVVYNGYIYVCGKILEDGVWKAAVWKLLDNATYSSNNMSRVATISDSESKCKSMTIDAGSIYVSYVISGVETGVWKYNTANNNGSVIFTYSAPNATYGNIVANNHGVYTTANGSSRYWLDGTYVTTTESGTIRKIAVYCPRQYHVYDLPFEDHFQNGSTYYDNWFAYDYDNNNGYAPTYWERYEYNSNQFALRHRFGTNSQSADLASPAIRIPEGYTANLTFYTKVDYLSDLDIASIYVISDAGEVFTTDNFENFQQEHIWSLDDHLDEISTNTWHRFSVDLSEFAGEIINLVFFYNGTNAHTWYIDDIEVTGTVAINEEVAEELELSVMPNPASDFISITGLDGIEDITIYNTLGQVVKTAQVSDGETISIEGLSQGVYMLQSEKSAQTIKFIVE